MTRVKKLRSYPSHLFLGIALIAVFWTASWAGIGLLGEYSFFPLWLGYILTVDAIVLLRSGTSLLTRASREFVALFLLSAPVWWIFEFLNYFVLNWRYIGAETYSVPQIILVATVNFSTVIPAVFETTELMSTFGFVRGFRAGSRIRVTFGALWLAMYVGVFAFATLVFLPRYAFPLTWVWLFLLVDPLNSLRGRPSLFEQAARGDWRNVIALSLAGLTCGFFWEMWNFFALPKWYYTIPFFEFLHVFEMPLLGYLGYLPFSWELYALYHFVWGMLGKDTHAAHAVKFAARGSD